MSAVAVRGTGAGEGWEKDITSARSKAIYGSVCGSMTQLIKQLNFVRTHETVKFC